MSSKQTKSVSGGGGSSKLSKEPAKKQQPQQQQQQEKPLTARKPSVDKPRSGTSSLPSSPLSNPKTSVAAVSTSSRRAASPLTRSGTASLPSSPLNNPKASAKKTASPSLVKKDPLKVKAPPKMNDKKMRVDKSSGRGAIGGPDVEKSSPQPTKAVSPIRSSRPRGAESGTFARRPPPPAEVKIKMDRPDVSPRSRRIQESASRFLEVKKREIGDQKEMENFVADQLHKVQVSFRQVDEVSTTIGRCSDRIQVEKDELKHLIERTSALLRELDGTLSEIRDGVAEFIDVAEKGAAELDEALKTIVHLLCNYSDMMEETGGVPPGGPDDDKGGKQGGGPGKSDSPGGDLHGNHPQRDQSGGGLDSQNGNLVLGDRTGKSADGPLGDGTGDHPQSLQPMDGFGHSVDGDYTQAEKDGGRISGPGDHLQGASSVDESKFESQDNKPGDESGDQAQHFKSVEIVDFKHGYLTEELVQSDVLGVGLDAKGPGDNLGNGKPGGENVYYTQISKPLQRHTGHSQRENFVTKPCIYSSSGLFGLEGLAVIEKVFEDPSNMHNEDIRYSADVIWSALADTFLQKQVAKGTFTKEIVKDLLEMIVVYLSQKQSEGEDVSGLGGFEKACCILSPSSNVRKSLDGFEGMNALISLLSPIKSNASNPTSDFSTKTDAVVSNETTEEYLSEGIEGSEKAEPTRCLKGDLDISIEGTAEIKEDQGLETEGHTEIKEYQGLETEGPTEMKEDQGLETEGPTEIKEEQGLETEGPTESMDTSEEEETTVDKDRLGPGNVAMKVQSEECEDKQGLDISCEKEVVQDVDINIKWCNGR